MGNKGRNFTILNFNDIKETVRDDNLGGNLFDEELVKYCINQFKEHTGIIINNSSKACQKLQVECERNKRDLSSIHQSKIYIDALADGEHFNITITRPQFEFIYGNIYLIKLFH